MRPPCTPPEAAPGEDVPNARHDESVVGNGEGGGSSSPTEHTEHPNSPAPAPAGLTVGQYAAAYGLTADFLRPLGVSDQSYMSIPAVRLLYRDVDGKELASRFRLALDDPHGGSGKFQWTKAKKSKPWLYGLWRLADGRNAGYVVLVFRESDCQVLWFHGIPAVALPEGELWDEHWAKHLDGITTIYVLVVGEDDLDERLGWIATSSIRERVRLVRLAADVAGLIALHLRGTDVRNEWERAMAESVPWAEDRDAARQRAIAEAFTIARDLLYDPNILDRIKEAIVAGGYAGDTTPPLLVFIVLTSRLLERPINLAFVAESASGKNRAIDAVLDLFPVHAYYKFTAGSPRSLIYSAEDFRHRIVIMSEADSIPEEGSAGAAFRSIAADSRMTYEVVLANPRTNKFETHRIVKEGPTGIVTTSTKSLSPQLRTRVLEAPLRDDPAQTKKIMLAHAAEVAGSAPVRVDPRPFVALQVWLEEAGVHKVVVPFARELAELVAASEVRMRRDFRQLLTCIQALGCLRQCQRERDSEGRIVATVVEDYGDARAILEPIFESIVAEGVTAAIRETVGAVPVLGDPISETELAQILGLAKSTTCERVAKALDGGWLVNLETWKGRPARLRRGAPLPGAADALPTPEQVLARIWKDAWQSVFGCSGETAGGAGGPPSPPPAPDDAVAAEAFLAPRADLVETYAPVLQELHQELYRRQNYMPVDEAVFFLCTRNAQLTFDVAYRLINKLDGIPWIVYEDEEQGTTVLIPIWNI
jgi:hypothetical protein